MSQLLQSVHIAIPEPTSFDTAYNQRALPQYLHALHAAGATPILIPLHESRERVARILATVQGILLPGSPADIDPEKYGAERHPRTAPADAPRAAVDELLLADAFQVQKPVFAICQGLQLLNTWRGGTLIQDIPAEVGTAVNHDPGRMVAEAHPLAVTAGTRLAALVAKAAGGNGETQHASAFRMPHQHDPNTEPLREDAEHLYVNSSHHQAVRTVGENLTISARSPEDGVIEAVELASPEHWVVGVQWHPERTCDQSALSRHLFRAFVDAAQCWTPRRMEEAVVPA